MTVPLQSTVQSEGSTSPLVLRTSTNRICAVFLWELSRGVLSVLRETQRKFDVNMSEALIKAQTISP